MLAAFHAYQNTPDKDLYANLYMNIATTNMTQFGILVTFVYLKPIANPAAYVAFQNLTAVFDSTGLMTLHELMANFPSPPLPPRRNWYTASFEPTKAVLSDLGTLLLNAPEISQSGAIEGGTFVVTLEPINAHAVTAGQANAGGNALGLKPVTQTWIILGNSWYGEDNDNVANKAMRSLQEKVVRLAKQHDAALDYLFMNDASSEQRVLASYGEPNVQKLRAVQRRYDPDSVFQRLVPGGQKIP